VGSGIANRPRRRRRGSLAIACASAALDGRDPLFERLAAHVDLHARLERREGRRALLRQTLGDLQPVDRVDPVEALRDRARLVALDRRDEMPDEGEVPQPLHLCQGFLHLVFAEVALSGGVRRAEALGGKRLADGHENYVTGVAPGRRARRCDAGLYGLQALFDCVHNAPDYAGAPKGWPLKLPHRTKSIWTFPNSSPSSSRTKPPTCTCPPGSRR
jgi:hypothetical protein